MHQDADSQPDKAALARRWTRAEAERQSLIRLARSRGLSPQDAEDCVHESMLRVIVRPDLDEARMGALLTTVVVRSAVDMHRRAKTTTRMVAKVTATTRIHDADPAGAVCDRDEARWTAALVAQLPTTQRQVLVARAEGQSVKQIARDMATTAKAIESLISRARRSTRHAMASSLGAAFGFCRRLLPFAGTGSGRAGSTTTGLAAAAAAGVAIFVTLSVPGFRSAISQGLPGADSGSEGTSVQASGNDRADAAPLELAVASHGSGTGHGKAGGPPHIPLPTTPRSAPRTIGSVDVVVNVPGGKAGGGGGVEQHDDGEDQFIRAKRCVDHGTTLGLYQRPGSAVPAYDGEAFCRRDRGSLIWRHGPHELDHAGEPDDAPDSRSIP